MGAILVATVTLVGTYLAFRPEATFLDRWFFSIVGASRSAWYADVTSLRFPQIVVAGSVIAAVVALFSRDRLRSLACLVGPPLALVTSELVVKPLVGRHVGQGLSYPSGSTVGAAALTTAAVLAAPDRWRTATAVGGAVYTLWMSVAVIALQWHYPTDALAGVAYGVGVVLLVDGVTGWVGTSLWGWTGGRRPMASRGG